MADSFQSLLALARDAHRTGDASAALDLYHRAAAASSDPADLAHCLRHVGDLARQAGDREAAREALDRAEYLYRETVSDPLSLANTMRLRALLDGSTGRWREARQLYEAAATDGCDLADALDECDRHLA